MSGASIETLKRRVAYGGKKGAAAKRRLALIKKRGRKIAEALA